MRNSFDSGNGPSVTAGAPVPSERTTRAWSGKVRPSLNTISPESRSSWSNACWNSMCRLMSSGAQSTIPPVTSWPVCIISMYFMSTSWVSFLHPAVTAAGAVSTSRAQIFTAPRSGHWKTLPWPPHSAWSNNRLLHSSGDARDRPFRRGRHLGRMQNGRDRLDAVDQARPRSDHDPVGVDRPHLRTGETFPDRHSLHDRAVEVEPARRHQNDVRFGVGELGPGRLDRPGPGAGGDRLTAGGPDQVRHPVAGRERRLDPLQHRHPRSGLAGHRGRDGIESLSQGGHE